MLGHFNNILFLGLRAGNLTDLLEAEIQSTTSWWVKIRNRLYITLMRQAVKAIVADIKQKIA